MPHWQYKILPAPTKGIKGKGVKGPQGRFANALEILMNDMAAEGWEFQRAETLPSLERSGFTGSTTEWRNLLVFRREIVENTDTQDMMPAPKVHSTPIEMLPAYVSEQYRLQESQSPHSEPATEQSNQTIENPLQRTDTKGVLQPFTSRRSEP